MDRNQLAALMRAISRIKKGEVDEAQLWAMVSEEFDQLKKTTEQRAIDAETIRRLRIQNKKIQDLVLSLKNELREIKINRNQILKRLADLRKMNKSLAASLGSCPLCWGEDEHCPTCEGSGVPGWKNVNSKLFNIYVLPVLEKKYGINIGKK